MAADPVFLTVPKHYYGQMTVANTNRDGATGTYVTLATGSNSYVVQITQIVVQATVTTTAGMVRLFLSLDGGTTNRLYQEIPIAAATGSASVAEFRTTVTPTDLFLADVSTVIKASTHNAEAINIIASGVASA